jgi:hypothetical protein
LECGFDKALWRIGELVPNIECGTVINPETGDKARVGIDGSRWIEKADAADEMGARTDSANVSGRKVERRRWRRDILFFQNKAAVRGSRSIRTT